MIYIPLINCYNHVLYDHDHLCNCVVVCLSQWLNSVNTKHEQVASTASV